MSLFLLNDNPNAIFSFVLQSSNVENLSPHVIRQVTKEVGDLCSDPPEGIKLLPSEEDITDIQASIEGPCKLMDNVVFHGSAYGKYRIGA